MSESSWRYPAEALIEAELLKALRIYPIPGTVISFTLPARIARVLRDAGLLHDRDQQSVAHSADGDATWQQGSDDPPFHQAGTLSAGSDAAG